MIKSSVYLFIIAYYIRLFYCCKDTSLIANIKATSILAGNSYRTDPDHKKRERKGDENLPFFTYDIVIIHYKYSSISWLDNDGNNNSLEAFIYIVNNKITMIMTIFH